MRITPQEREAGVLSPERLRHALDCFRDRGLLVIEDAYDLGFLQEVRQAYERELDAYLEQRGGLSALEGKTFGLNHIGFFPRIVPPIGDSQIVAHPIAAQLIFAILGADCQCSFFHTNTAMPGSGVQPVHRDAPPLFLGEMSAAHPTVSLVLNIPLCDFTEENGSTEVWLGTHMLTDSGEEGALGLEERAQGYPSLRANLPLGSFALRDLRAWHRGMPNRADYARTMFALVYSRGWARTVPTNIPRSTWEGWSEEARRIFRRNRVVEDAEHLPMTWETLAANG